jgi:hypothetical protein
MKIIKTDKIEPCFVKDIEVYAPAICSQEAYKDIGDMLKFNGLENRDVEATLNYDENGNWSISLSIKLKETDESSI